MGYVWLAAIVIFAVVEAVTPQLVSIWFALGSVAALVASLFNVDSWIQFIIFVVVSAILLVPTRKLAARISNTAYKTNVESLVGESAVVTSAIDNDKAEGLIQVRGQIWSAKTENNEKIEKDEKVIITAIAGVKLVVKKEGE